MVLYPGFDSDFLSSSREIGCEEYLCYDLFSVEWNVKPLLNQSLSMVQLDIGTGFC